MKRILSPLALVALPLMLAACSQQEEKIYEADATDESGGELIATPADAEGVPVETPDVEMTPAAPDAEAAPAEEAPAE